MNHKLILKLFVISAMASLSCAQWSSPGYNQQQQSYGAQQQQLQAVDQSLYNSPYYVPTPHQSQQQSNSMSTMMMLMMMMKDNESEMSQEMLMMMMGMGLINPMMFLMLTQSSDSGDNQGLSDYMDEQVKQSN